MAKSSKTSNCRFPDTHHLLLDRTDFALGGGPTTVFDCIVGEKRMGVNILKSIDKGPFQMGTTRDTLAEGTEALNVDNVFQADNYDAFDSDVDEAPTAQTMFMENLSSADPVYDEANLSYDSNILSENNMLFRAENEKVKQHYKELYDSIKITRTKHIEKTTVLLTENENLKAQLHENLKYNTMESVKPRVLAPSSVETLCEIVEEAKVERPLDRSLASACLYTKHTQELLEYIMLYIDSGYSKHMTVDPHGYGDYVIGDCVISRVYYVEGLEHNLFFVRQFCHSDLEVAFRKHSCYVRDIDGVELIKGSRGSNLYTISVEDIMKSSRICLLSKASKNKSWLWHRRLNHLNFGTINDLARKDLVRGLPRLKFEKDHLCSVCQLGKSKKYTHKPKTKNTNLEVLNTLHMDLCGPMRVQTINGKKYILVIVDDYSWFTWVKFLRLKDETPEVVIKFLKQIQVGVNKTIRYIHTDNGTEFVNKDLTAYYERVGIFHQKTVLRTPQQNDIVKRRNRTLVEAARTTLIFSKAPMFLWAEAVATACYTQNRSLIHTLHNKTPYELVHDKKPDLTFFRVFDALCYPTNDSEDLGKLKLTADIQIFVSYAPSRKGDRTKSGSCSTLCSPTTNKELEILFQPMFDEYLEPTRVERPVFPAPAVLVSITLAGTPSSTTIDQDAPFLSHSPSSLALQSPSLHQGVAVESTLMENNPFAPVDNDPFINIFSPEPTFEASSFGD
ncbi:retrovirus-related pol polyprotein from transposon TNT 1-94, partial [Tanacetum coccineum]